MRKPTSSTGFLFIAFFLFFISPLFATIRYVKPAATGAANGSSWDNSSADLQGIINLSAAGDTIWVAAGSYIPTQDPFGNATPTDNRDKTFYLKDSTKLFGSFAGTETILSQRNITANPTILSGDFLGDDAGFTNNGENAYHVLLTVNSNAATLVDGFTVKGGNANGSGSITIGSTSVAKNAGGGIYNSISNISITNCTFSTNYASNGGGGGYCSSSSPIFFYSVFDNNKSGSNGTGIGAGLYSTGGPLTVSKCIFNANVGGAGGGIYLYNSSSILSVIKNCVFTANSCTSNKGGGAINSNNSIISIENSLFSANTYTNSQGSGAGVYAGGTNGNGGLSITNSIFTGTNSTNAGGGTCIFTSIPTVIKNIIVWGNTHSRTGSFIALTGLAAPASLSYSDVQGGGGGTGGTNTDPLFVNAASPIGADGIWGTADDGFALQNTSPLLDAGTNTGTPAFDIVGDSIYNLTKDIGAYENQQGQNVYSSTPACQSVTIANVTGNQWFYFRNANGIIAALNPNGTNLGTVTAQISDTAGAIAYNGKTYISRSINFTSSNFGAGITTTNPYSLRLYYYNSEITEYNTTAGGNHLLANFSMDWLQGGTGCTLASYAGNALGNIINTSLSSGAYGAASNGFYLQFNLDHFTIFAATDNTSNSVLPLTLLSFTVMQKGKTNNLQWRTSNEINTRNFSVEKSTDGRNFTTIGTVAAAGSSNNVYAFADETTINGAFFYRLKMADMDGRFTYSHTIEITANNKTISLYPNPAQDKAILQINDAKLLGTVILLTDLKGTTIKTIALKSIRQNIDLQALPAGIYIVRLVNGQSLKLVKRG